jgi:hypothetical protein
VGFRLFINPFTFYFTMLAASEIADSRFTTTMMMMMTWKEAMVFFVSFAGATLSTTNPLWTDLGLSPVLRSERLAGGGLSRGTTLGRK